MEVTLNFFYVSSNGDRLEKTLRQQQVSQERLGMLFKVAKLSLLLINVTLVSTFGGAYECLNSRNHGLFFAFSRFPVTFFIEFPFPSTKFSMSLSINLVPSTVCLEKDSQGLETRLTDHLLAWCPIFWRHMRADNT